MFDRQLNFLMEQCEFNTYDGRKILNRLDEAGKISLSDKIVSALYKTAVDKFKDVDFGEIESSKGDITRLKHYETLNDSLEALNDICTSTNNNCPELQIVNESMKIVQAYKKEFCLSFIQERPMGIMLYNTIVLSIICGTNICIQSAIDFLRTPGSDMKTAMDVQKSANKNDNILIQNLAKFNTGANNGDLKKFFDSFLKKENFIGAGSIGAITLGSGAVIAAVALASAIAFIPVMRELIYFFYNFRMSVSEYFKAQAQFLEINLAEVRASDSAKNKAQIIKKHETRIRQLEKISNTFEVKFNDANRKTKKEVSTKIQPDKIEQTLDPEAFQIM